MYHYPWEEDAVRDAYEREKLRTREERQRIAFGIGCAERALICEQEFADDASNYCPHCHIMLPTVTKICDMCGYDGNKRRR